MASKTPAPAPAAIDAWLAGELPDEEAAEIERYFDENPMDVVASSAVVMGVDLDETVAPGDRDPQLRELIEIVKTDHALDMPAPSDDAWKEILIKSKNTDFLGTIGDYEVLEVIATGGMGIVLKARDPELDRIAAVKVLSPDLATNATARERFLREARAAAKLEHENILPIYGVHAEAVPYFAMRYVAGGSVQDAIDSGKNFSLDELKSIGAQTAAALEVAHKAGIIHRDIKPANLLLDDDGEKVWVCDFGIARSTEDPSLTYAGNVAGTPQYMSPEQADGKELDGRSDLFSLGAVLYRCATGRPAFEGNTSASVMQNVATAEPRSATQFNTKLPAWFERLLNNLLAKDPRDRPRDASLVMASIEEEHSPRPRRRARRNRKIAIAATALAAIVALIAGLARIPAVKEATNRLLASKIDQVFTIDGKFGVHTTLANAVAAAKPGDTIEIPGGAPIAIDNLQLAAGKPLRLRAASESHRPTFTTAILGAPGIVTRSALTLEGIDFLLNPRAGSDGILIAHSAPLTISDCRFTSMREVSDPYSDIKSRTVDLYGSASADVSDSDFDLQETNAFTFFDAEGLVDPAPKASVSVKNTRIAAFYGFSLFDPSSANSQFHIEASGLNFSGNNFINRLSHKEFPHIECLISNSELATSRSLCWFRGADKATVIGRFHWSGVDNAFPLANDHVSVGKLSLPHPLTIGHIGAFDSETKGPLQTGAIQILDRPEIYHDLKSAFDAAPSGSTLLFSGQIFSTEELLTRGDFEYHLRPAPGSAHATITSIHPIGHALFFTGPTTVSGLRFTRIGSGNDSVPILGIRSEGAPVSVEDCEFVTEAPGASALVFTDVAEASVRRCFFITPEGNGFGIAFTNPSGPSANVKLDECVFIGQSAIGIRSRVADTRGEVIAERCVAICDHLVRNHPHGRFYPFDLTFSNSIIDTSVALVSIPDTPAEIVLQNLGWNGSGNYYQQSVPALQAPRVFATEQFVPYWIDQISKLPKATEDGAIRMDLFDRSQLSACPTRKSLRSLLPSEIPAPALDGAAPE